MNIATSSEIKIIIIISFILSTLNCLSQIDTKSVKKKDYDYKIYYYPNKNKKEEGCIINKKREGLWKLYDENGILNYECFYHNNMKDGRFVYYYKDKKVHKTGYYKYNLIIDTLFIYSPEGYILSKSTWETTSNNHNKIIWRKLYAKDAKPDGTTEKIDGKYYTWTLGEKFELKMSNNVKMNVDSVK